MPADLAQTPSDKRVCPGVQAGAFRHASPPVLRKKRGRLLAFVSSFCYNTTPVNQRKDIL